MSKPEIIIYGLPPLEALDLEEILKKENVDATLSSGNEAQQEGKQYGLFTTSFLVIAGTRIAIHFLIKWLNKRKDKKHLPGFIIKTKGNTTIKIDRFGKVKIESGNGEQVIEVSQDDVNEKHLDAEDLNWFSELLAHIKDILKEISEEK